MKHIFPDEDESGNEAEYNVGDIVSAVWLPVTGISCLSKPIQTLRYRYIYRTAHLGGLSAYKCRFKQQLLFHAGSLIMPPLTYVFNPPSQLSLWEEIAKPEETHDFWQSIGFYSFHMRTGFESHLDVLMEVWTCSLSGDRQVC